MIEKQVFDLKIFRETKSITLTYYSLGEGACAQGKFGLATGIIKPYMNPGEAGAVMNEFKYQALSRFGIFNNAANLNNDGNFEKADNMILLWAMESGLYTFINALPEEEEQIKTYKAKEAAMQGAVCQS